MNDRKRFMEDLESPHLIPPRLVQRQPAIVRDGLCVLIGCTHMECTFRREALFAAPKERCNIAMGKDSERRWMDLPPDLRGWWKVPLPAAFVRHLGNTIPKDIPSEWEENGRLFLASAPPGRRAPEAVLPWRVRNRIGRIVQWWVERSL